MLKYLLCFVLTYVLQAARSNSCQITMLQRFCTLSDDILVYVQTGDCLGGTVKGWAQNEVASMLSGRYHLVSV